MTNAAVHFVTLLGLLGIPSIFSMTVYCIRQCRKFTKHLNILMAAQKAQMRAELLTSYKTYMKDGYIETEDLDEWENQYQAYHELVGANGVLDNKRKKLMALPDSPNNIPTQLGGN